MKSRTASRRTASRPATVPTMPRSKVQKMLDHHDVFVNTITDGRLMASNRYWIVEAERLRELFDWWNLPVEIGSYYVNGRVSRTVIEVPDFDPLVKPAGNPVTVRPMMQGRHPLMYEDGKMQVVLFESAERIGINRTYLDFVAPGWQDGRVTLEQEADQPMRPVTLRDDAKVVALLMPVRLS